MMRLNSSEQGLLSFLVLFLGMLFISLVAKAQELPAPPSSITVSWTIPATRENGDALPVVELSGYELFNSCDQVPFVIPDGNTASHTLPVTLPFDCTFTIKAVDLDGVRSGLSAPLQVKFNAPVAPVFNAVQVN